MLKGVIRVCMGALSGGLAREARRRLYRKCLAVPKNYCHQLVLAKSTFTFMADPKTMKIETPNEKTRKMAKRPSWILEMRVVIDVKGLKGGSSEGRTIVHEGLPEGTKGFNKVGGAFGGQVYRQPM